MKCKLTEKFIVEDLRNDLMRKEKVLISSCLLGECVRYDGKGGALDQNFLNVLKSNLELVSFCPEYAGGLPTSRPPAEITGGEGSDVLYFNAKVVTADGENVTEQFIAGGREALACCVKEGIKYAVLKERSPSCGVRYIYDGSFNKTIRQGRGVAAALLAAKGVHVFSDEEYIRFKQALLK